jgi:peptide/nickel transport system permease protein
MSSGGQLRLGMIKHIFLDGTTDLRVIARHMRRDKPALFGLAIVALVVSMALFADFMAPYDPSVQDLTKRLQPPSFEHPFGLDEFGRDMLSRIIHGARVSMLVGVTVTTLALVVGMLLGVLSGYFGGKVDMLVMRVADIFLAFPGLIIAIGFVAVLGQSITNVIVSLVLVNWPGYARVVRGQVLRIRNIEYVEAAKAIGASHRSIMLGHVLPNTMSPLIVLATIGMGWAILAEAGLSFLGLGVKPPTPSWGAIISSGRTYLIQAPHIATISGLILALTILAFNLVGDAIRDALDPRMRI